MTKLRKRRSHTEASEGANKTRLMYSCNLNFGLFNRYLKELLDADLIEKIEENNLEGSTITIYKTSAKGRELLKVLRKASELLSS